MNADGVLAGLPAPLRDELLGCYGAICANYLERRWEPAELNGGKFAEVVYCIVHGALNGAFPASASKPKNMLTACRSLEQYPADPTRVGDRTLRILIPRFLPVLYEIRSNRGVGHVGGDVDPNHEDAEAVLTMASWVVAELVRVFHNVSLGEAQAAVDSIVSKRHPLIWDAGERKRVLDPSLSAKDQSLLLLYAEGGWVPSGNLCGWVEYSNLSAFRRNVLGKLHTQRLIEHDVGLGRAKISPTGIARVERDLLAV